MRLKRIFTRMFATRGSGKRLAERPKPPTQPYVLLLNYSQFYAVAEAIQMDYVTLHNSITRNPARGLEKALVERERHNRDALGQVFEMIEAIQPYPNTFAAFEAARAHVQKAEHTLARQGDRRRLCGGD
ncbi:hypothetical protein A264_11465 [Pseudomonas syringae pv. actinidiae ICMP 19071]|uniref:hypothetical protein n=1 Tax=Pseudomonas syringae TaxID=317 RepID=UPI000356EE89|nr:hypothetical protein [Pseudomonas syringae]EPM43084.1 hypothetical protein A262_28512 [Pseudomonas syringae pv. actinidiae ICMP 19073]EPM60334.1 hypothetical protein A264_11465 [Pseudomonas syringae pv. actinidiae ICMP 19071]EPM74090.1 hypothetical protein A3SO_27153 [Pseudomonas syringae pv. actinidiae ICMP 19072]OSN77200.1 hypothetical protein BV351_02301 [Pseudomonas syringae pv. actinidiae]RMS11364.1 hypothetical protein ALP75_204592 [Pseudomonas syringae pv. actinidiae]